jgi:hypothetical protein
MSRLEEIVGLACHLDTDVLDRCYRHLLLFSMRLDFLQTQALRSLVL